MVRLCVDLLEKSRVVRHAEKERSFHIFYQLLEGTNAEQRTKYLLEPAKAYRYLENSARIEGGDDAAEFRDTIAAMATIGFKEREMDDLYRILSGILHLGNMAFTQGKRDDAANIKDSAIADKVSHTLGIKSPDFTRCLLKPRVKAGREWVTAMVTASKVRVLHCRQERRGGHTALTHMGTPGRVLDRGAGQGYLRPSVQVDRPAHQRRDGESRPLGQLYWLPGHCWV